MDLLNRAYNRLELLAVDADSVLSDILRRWPGWLTSRRLAMPGDRQRRDIGPVRPEMACVTRGEAHPDRPDSMRLDNPGTNADTKRRLHATAPDALSA